MTTRLSKNFTLEEFLISQTAERNGIDMTPSPEIIHNIQELVDTCMQPLRTALRRGIFISSGYRPPALNRLIGGSRTSAHRFGKAADFRVIRMTPLKTTQKIVELELPFDQVIHEFGRWVHLGIATRLRGQLLTAYRKDGRVTYAQGLHEIGELL